ncbi:sulfotransferase ssu-1-like [Ornithodoros turicata]|uniref:sulfotransferase ssu-1-like n=1 Tax=Ornithodoros turicata TaxID=34597 RepID=UPI0031391615
MMWKPRCNSIDGMLFSAHFSEEIVRSALSYEPRPGDIFLVSYPKCGTTWMQHILYGIFNDGKAPSSYSEVSAKMPFLESQGAEVVANLSAPRVIKTHLPFGKQPYSAKAKYVYITRNPYDCCVSYYYHIKHMPVYAFGDGAFDVFFDVFVQGRIGFGDYFDHLLPWYAHRDDPNVFFLTYEDLKENTALWIRKVADFLGSGYGDILRENPAVVESIVEATTVANMKKLVNPYMKNIGEIFRSTPFDELPRWARLKLECGGERMKEPMTGDFIRKGEVGDWKNHFSAEQVKRMKERIAFKTGGSDVMTLWSKLDL